MVDETDPLLSILREEGATLVETEIPSSEELRPIVGALVKALDRVVDVDAFRAPAAPVSDATGNTPVSSAAPVPSVNATPGQVDQRESAQDAELEALRAQVADLQQAARSSVPEPAPGEPTGRVEPAPVEPAPVEPAPVEPAPVAPATTSPGDVPSTGTWQEPAPADPASPTTTEGQS